NSTSDFNSEVKMKGFKVYEVDVKAKNGHINPGRMYDCNVNCAVGMELIFDNKSVRVVYVKNQISPY
ncbi:MAG TPA: hypothetical protein VK772_17680, partial [Puia sp.]|nr:hypothetical protein [Puia sp.]